MKKILSLILLTSALSDVSFSMHNIYRSPNKSRKGENLNYFNQDLQLILETVGDTISNFNKTLLSDEKNQITKAGIEKIFGLKKHLYGSDSTWKAAIYTKLTKSSLFGKLDSRSVDDAFSLWGTADDRISFLKAFQDVLENAISLNSTFDPNMDVVNNSEIPACIPTNTVRTNVDEAAFSMPGKFQNNMRSYPSYNSGAALDAYRIERNEDAAALDMPRQYQNNMHRSHRGSIPGEVLETEATFHTPRKYQNDMDRSYSGYNYSQALEADRLAASNNSTSIIGTSSDGSVLSRGSSVSRSSSPAVVPVTKNDVIDYLVSLGVKPRPLEILDSRGLVDRLVNEKPYLLNDPAEQARFTNILRGEGGPSRVVGAVDLYLSL